MLDDDRPAFRISIKCAKLTRVVAVAATALGAWSLLIVMDKRIAPVALLLGIVLSAALGGCHVASAQAPGWYDPYASGIGPMVHGSRRLGDQ
jgi:hypothetical protein